MWFESHRGYQLGVIMDIKIEEVARYRTPGGVLFDTQEKALEGAKKEIFMDRMTALHASEKITSIGSDTAIRNLDNFVWKFREEIRATLNMLEDTE